MGGVLGVESTVGRGSHFWFKVSLPECLEPAVAADVVPACAGPLEGEPALVLPSSGADAATTSLVGSRMLAPVVVADAEAGAESSIQVADDAAALAEAVSPTPVVVETHPLRALVAEVGFTALSRALAPL